MESEKPERKRRRRRIRKPKTFGDKASRLVKLQIGKNEGGEHQWEILVGVSLAVVLVIAFVVYVIFNIQGR